LITNPLIVIVTAGMFIGVNNDGLTHSTDLVF